MRTYEGSATIRASAGKISKGLAVFYNPIMKFNRDISIVLLNILSRKGMQIADPLAGSGIRSIRFLKELNKDIITTIAINDHSKESMNSIKKNFKLNKLSTKKVSFHNTDANLFLLNSSGFDYIDIDPFGSPNPFLDSAVKRLARNGILAVTATDTAPLCGTYSNACKRKYWAVPLRNELMHEVGIRILIRKIQLIGAQYDKALTPLFSYARDHYFRIFFQSEKSKDECDNIIKQHHYLSYCPKCSHHQVKKETACTQCKKPILIAGPLWTGQLWQKTLINRMLNQNKDSNINRFLEIIEEESQHNIVGFTDLHKLARITKKAPPKTEEALQKLTARGYIAMPTHFSAHGIKTNASTKIIKNLLFG